MTWDSPSWRVQRGLNYFSRCLWVQYLENHIKPPFSSMTPSVTVSRVLVLPFIERRREGKTAKTRLLTTEWNSTLFRSQQLWGINDVVLSLVLYSGDMCKYNLCDCMGIEIYIYIQKKGLCAQRMSLYFCYPFSIFFYFLSEASETYCHQLNQQLRSKSRSPFTGWCWTEALLNYRYTHTHMGFGFSGYYDVNALTKICR